MTSVIVDRIGNFTVVPNAFIDNASMSHDAVRLFLLLRRLSNGQDDVPIAFPSYDTIKTRTGIGSYTTIAKALRELESAGWMMRQKRFGKSTIYVLTTPAPEVKNASPTPGVVLHQMESSATPGVGQSYTNCRVTRNREQETSNKTQERGAARRTRPQVEAPDALKRQNSPRASGAPKWAGPTPMPAPIAAWYACTKDTSELNTVQADSIVAAVTDVDLWSRVLTKAMLYHRRPNVAAFLDYYRAGDVPDYRASKSSAVNGRPAAPAPAPTTPAVSERSLARIAEMQAAAAARRAAQEVTA